MTATLEERFFAKVTPAGPDDCWHWRNTPTRQGYGRFCNGGQRYVMAHRWAYEFLITEIPAGLVLDHLCRNPICVNPWHLDPVTIAENVRRGYHPESDKTHCPKNHPYNQANTYVTPDGHRDCKICRRASDQRRRERRRNSPDSADLSQGCPGHSAPGNTTATAKE